MADDKIKSVAIIGAGASGAITAASFAAEKYFEKITIFERRYVGNPLDRIYTFSRGALSLFSALLS
jgi:2-polyprenyl-6-methoxyphenol hydroxylase-like FAD-dependent oxidoreductase